MAIVQLGSTTTGTSDSGVSLTFSHTVTSGTDVLVVSFGSGPDTDSITSVVFNASETMTQAAATGVNGKFAAIYYLVNPTATTANIVITIDAGPNTGITATAINYDGVNTATPIGDTTTATSDASVTTATLNVTSTSVNNLILDLVSIQHDTDQNFISKAL